MNLDLVTLDDLEVFRARLLADLTDLLLHNSKGDQKPWLKGTEVRKLLGISSGTLQNLRISGRLKPSKVGGIYYYRREDIEKMIIGAGK